MAINDSDIGNFDIDANGIRTNRARINKLLDRRNFTGQSDKRIASDAKLYSYYLQRSVDSDKAEEQYNYFDSDKYGVPAAWNRNNLSAGWTSSDSEGTWTKIRNIVGTQKNSAYVGGDSFAGAPYVIAAIDSDNTIRHTAFQLLLKAHLTDWLKFDTVEGRAIVKAINAMSDDSEGRKKLVKAVAKGLDSDFAANNDILSRLIDSVTTDTNTSIFNYFNAYGLIPNDSDDDILTGSVDGRGIKWNNRRRLAAAVIDGIQYDSEYKGGFSYNFGNNALVTKMAGLLNEASAANGILQFQTYNSAIPRYLRFDWIERDSDGSGNLTDSDSEGYSLNYRSHVNHGFGDAKNIKDSDYISLLTFRNEQFFNLIAAHVSAVDSEKMDLLTGSAYRDQRDPFGKGQTNYFNYHPTFKERFKSINKRFFEQTLIEAYLSRGTSETDSDRLLHRSKLWNTMYRYLENVDSDNLALGTLILNGIDSDSDSQHKIAKMFIEAMDYDSDLQNSVTRDVVDTIKADSDIQQDLKSVLQGSGYVVTQEHIVNDSEASYSSFTFNVPSGFELPISNINIKTYINGVKMSQNLSYNKSGTAVVNHSTDVSSILVSTDESNPYITVNFSSNLQIGELLAIEYPTTSDN
jgi:hypothetical protein